MYLCLLIVLKGVFYRWIFFMLIWRNGMLFVFFVICWYFLIRIYVIRLVIFFLRFFCLRILSLFLFFSFLSCWKLKNRMSYYCLLLLEVFYKFVVVFFYLFVCWMNRDIWDDLFIIDLFIFFYVCFWILLFDRELIYYIYLCYIMIFL